jgi:hypothetical protein
VDAQISTQPDSERINLERYIEQLIEDLRAAHKLEGISVYPAFEDNPEPVTTMFQLTEIDRSVFPPVQELSESQLQRLSEEIIALIESFNYIINLPKRLPPGMVYEKLLSRWTSEIPCIRDGGLSASGWMFCEDEPDPCSMREWCDWLTCEIDSATLPVYNGIYDDEGNKIEVYDIAIPDLCLSCADFLHDDWEENLLCNMTRDAKRKEGEEFMCHAWRKRVD